MISIFGQPGIGGDSLLMPHGNSIHAKRLQRKNSGSKSRGDRVNEEEYGVERTVCI